MTLLRLCFLFCLKQSSSRHFQSSVLWSMPSCVNSTLMQAVAAAVGHAYPCRQLTNMSQPSVLLLLQGLPQLGQL